MRQWIYGKNSVLQRLKSNEAIEELIVIKNKHQDVIMMAQKKGIKTKEVSKNDMDKLVRGNHQGIVIAIKEYEAKSLEDIIESVDMSSNPILVMCDQLEDPHNLGAILRTCDATGVKGVIIGKHRSVSLNATVAKVSTGAIETVPVAIVTNLSRALSTLKEKGFWIIGADNTQAVSYKEMPKDRPVVLVVGSEGKGISNSVLKQCDYRVVIPMLGEVNSLNVSVATGVLLYELISK